MTPWSVRPMAGWSNAAARSASLSMLQAPSSSEYSEWTWRCATVGELIGEGTIGVASDRIGARPGTCGITVVAMRLGDALVFCTEALVGTYGHRRARRGRVRALAQN